MLSLLEGWRVTEAGEFNAVFDELFKSKRLSLVDRLVVLAETGSTQDEARRVGSGAHGMVIVALHQTAGRGRLGRAWVDTQGMGLAVTLVVDAARLDRESLSISTGLGTCFAAEAALGGDQLGLRWPNDVVEPAGGRKVAGVLIDQVGTTALIGVGINVQQERSHWPAGLAERAVSLRELGSQWGRAQVFAELLVGLQSALALSPSQLLQEWSLRDVLRNRRSTFVHANRQYSGLVRTINPTSHLELILDSGETVILPALTTSLVH